MSNERDIALVQAGIDAAKASSRTEYNKYACEDEVKFDDLDPAAIAATLPDGQAARAQPAGEAVAHKFFAYDPDVGFETFKTEASAKQYAQDSIDSYREDAAEGWPEEVESVRWGVVLGTTKQIPVDDAGYDGSQGVADSGPYVDYVLTEYTSPPAQPAPVAGEAMAYSDAWSTYCGDWRDELVAIHGANGHIVSGIDPKNARKIIDEHNISIQKAIADAHPAQVPDGWQPVIRRAIQALKSRMCSECGDDECCMPRVRQARDDLDALLAAAPKPKGVE